MNVWYSLSEEPSDAYTQLVDHYGEVESPLDSRAARVRADIDELLADDLLDPNLVRQLEHLHVCLSGNALGPASEAFRGALGYFLGFQQATIAAGAIAADGDAELLNLRDRHERRAAEFLEEASARSWLLIAYGLTSSDSGGRSKFSFDFGEMRLHRIGTTSLVFRGVRLDEAIPFSEHEVAIKCVLPRYLTIGAITRSTEAYEEVHSVGLKCAPHIFESRRGYIAMAFVEGPTLAELLESRRPATLDRAGGERDPEVLAEARSLKREDVEFIRRLGGALCGVLAELFDKSHAHLDLSPANIIVNGSVGDELKLTLIDFGQNFAVTGRVGSSAAFRKAAIYVDPELSIEHGRSRWRCDAYSLGVILLEAASKRPLEDGNLADEMDRLWSGEVIEKGVWDGAPGLARVVEDLIEGRSDQRLAWFEEAAEDGNPLNPFEYVRQLIAQESKVMEIYENRTGTSGFGMLQGAALLRLWKWDQLGNLFRVGRSVDGPFDDGYREFPVLAWWALVSIACWSIALTSFAILTLADIGLNLEPEWAKQALEMLGAKDVTGNFLENLPGRMVALTFCLTAVTYYVNNFSMLAPRRLDGKLGSFADFTMRCTAVGLIFPIMFAMVMNPNAWPICAGAGTMLVVINNRVAFVLAKRGEDVAKRFSPWGGRARRFVDEVFREWWILMAAYSVSLLVIGALLTAGVAQDRNIYAFLVVAINVLKMYRLNCVHWAPQVRGNLSRVIFVLRRSSALDSKGVLSSQGPTHGAPDEWEVDTPVLDVSRSGSIG